MESERILITHGGGGTLTRRLIEEMIAPIFNNKQLEKFEDSSLVPGINKVVMTTDSHVVDPLFFPGGDIGKLSITGTVNDIATSGAEPIAISVGLIIEEGFPMENLKRILESMKATADEAEVPIITGDTKVVERGKADGIYINTSAVGYLSKGIHLSPDKIKPGDAILINGAIGNHEAAIISARNDLLPDVTIKSDCAPLGLLMKVLVDEVPEVSCARDPTRGGVAATLIELIESSGYGIELDEKNIPVDEDVRSLCDILGLDPLLMANEGKMLIFVPESKADKALKVLKKDRYGKNSRLIGFVTDEKKALVLKTIYGAKRIITMPMGSQLPRIC